MRDGVEDATPGWTLTDQHGQFTLREHSTQATINAHFLPTSSFTQVQQVSHSLLTDICIPLRFSLVLTSVAMSGEQ